MIVDTHVHVVSPDRVAYPQTRDTERASQVLTVRDLGQPEWPIVPVEDLLREMDAAGVDKALLVQSYYTYEYDNRYAVDAARAHPDRFRSVVVLDPAAAAAPDQLRDLVERGGARGLRLQHGRKAHSTLDDPRTFPLWQRAEELGIPVCIGDRLENFPRMRVVLERFPGVKVAFDHIWGNVVGDPPYDLLQPLFDLAVYPNAYVKVAVNNSYAAREGQSTPQQFYRTLIDRFGADRIMWGSNYPAHPVKFGTYASRVAIAREDFAFLDERERTALMGGTAVGFYPDLALSSVR